MSEERVIRINKVLRELNISLERAVDYLKDKGIAIEANPNAKISDKEFNILQNQFAGDKGNKEASKEVGEEKRKEKEALRVEREKEIDDKRKQDEERLRQQEVIKAKAVVTGPKQVGTIDLNPKKPSSAPIAKPIVVDVKAEAKLQEKPEIKTPVKVEAKPEVTVPVQVESEKAAVIPKEKVTLEKTEPKAVIEKVTPIVPEPLKQEATSEEKPAEEAFTTQYQKLSGATLTGQVIDLSQFNKPKKKKEEPKITPNKPGAPGAIGANSANKNKRKRIVPKPGAPKPGGTATPGTPGVNNPNKID